jgi:hypothetical protein
VAQKLTFIYFLITFYIYFFSLQQPPQERLPEIRLLPNLVDYGWFLVVDQLGTRWFIHGREEEELLNVLILTKQTTDLPISLSKNISLPPYSFSHTLNRFPTVSYPSTPPIKNPIPSHSLYPPNHDVFITIIDSFLIYHYTFLFVPSPNHFTSHFYPPTFDC